MTLSLMPAFATFMGLVLVCALYGLTISGHFPAEARADALRSSAGRIVLWGTIAIVLGVSWQALALAWQHLPWALAVIGAGAMALIAPLVLRPLPDSFVDQPIALLAFAALGTVLALTARFVFA